MYLKYFSSLFFVIASRGGISVENIQPSFLFARFENASAEAEVEIAQQHQAFQNPMFSLAGVSDLILFLDIIILLFLT